MINPLTMEKIEITLLIVAIVAALYGYTQYGRQIPSGKLKPRPFTWLIWGVLGTCISIIQIDNGAGLGTVGALLGAISGYVLGGMAWHYGERKIYKTDITSLILAAIVLAAWAFVGDAATAVMATAVYMIGFIPTVARGWRAPHKEGRAPFAMAVLKYVISFILLGSVSIETAVYPVALSAANTTFLIMLIIRRRQRQHRRSKSK
jgi:hypothetical protein